MDISKKDITDFAKTLSNAHHQFLNTMCISEEITKSSIGRLLKNRTDDTLIMEIAKRYAKYVRNECNIDVDNGEVQECQDLINEIIDCCEENNWFTSQTN